jgi:hypothetical protein
MRRAEGLVGGVILVVVTALALLLSGCDDSLETTFKKRRAASFTECETYCRATPLGVKFDRNGALLECRCDIIVTGDEVVE